MIDGHSFRAHRLAWLYVHGRWPAEQIDHIDQNTSNNRLNNLREATASQNKANKSPRRNNLLGVRGVSREKGGRKFRAAITKDGHRLYLGAFGTVKAASAAYQKAANKLFGEFASTINSASAE